MLGDRYDWKAAALKQESRAEKAESRVAELENVAQLVMRANKIDWAAQTDEEADVAWGQAIQAAREALATDSVRTATCVKCGRSSAHTDEECRSRPQPYCGEPSCFQTVDPRDTCSYCPGHDGAHSWDSVGVERDKEALLELARKAAASCEARKDENVDEWANKLAEATVDIPEPQRTSDPQKCSYPKEHAMHPSFMIGFWTCGCLQQCPNEAHLDPMVERTPDGHPDEDASSEGVPKVSIGVSLSSRAQGRSDQPKPGTGTRESDPPLHHWVEPRSDSARPFDPFGDAMSVLRDRARDWLLAYNAADPRGGGDDYVEDLAKLLNLVRADGYMLGLSAPRPDSPSPDLVSVATEMLRQHREMTADGKGGHFGLRYRAVPGDPTPSDGLGGGSSLWEDLDAALKGLPLRFLRLTAPRVDNPVPNDSAVPDFEGTVSIYDDHTGDREWVRRALQIAWRGGFQKGTESLRARSETPEKKP